MKRQEQRYLNLLRNLLKAFDARVLGKSLAKLRSSWNGNLNRRRVTLPYVRVSHVGFPQVPSMLGTLCDEYGSDKGSNIGRSQTYSWTPHTYTDFYTLLFDHCRDSIYKVFECGIGTTNAFIPANMSTSGRPGASLRVWRDYFPNAQVFGADIDRDVLFSEEGINTFFVDQTDPLSIKAMWDNIAVSDFDLIIDDGLHDIRANICLFLNSVDRLAAGGTYVIEDVADSALGSTVWEMRECGFHAIPIALTRSEPPYVGGNNLVVFRKPPQQRHGLTD